VRTKTFHGGRSISLLGTAGQNKQAYFFPGADKTGGWPTLASRWFHGLSRLRLPHLSRSSTGGHRVVRVHVHSSERSSGHECYMPLCPHGCNRYYGAGYLHFITTSCLPASRSTRTAAESRCFSTGAGAGSEAPLVCVRARGPLLTGSTTTCDI